MHQTHILALPRGQTLVLGREPLVMGILNVTPDSFSDGGTHAEAAPALAHASSMAAEGADILDLGGESTRPGADEVPVQVELDRVIPVLDALRATGFARPISIDTCKPLVADQALQSGAAIVNDVHGLQRDPEMAAVAALHGAPVIAMHWDKGRDLSRSLLDEMRRWFDRTLAIAADAGLPPSQLVLDPGFGFGKSLAENYLLLRDLPRLYPGHPILVGTSRKSMIGRLLGHAVNERLAGTLATTVLAYGHGAHIFRVHDVAPNRDVLAVARATLYGLPSES